MWEISEMKTQRLEENSPLLYFDFMENVIGPKSVIQRHRLRGETPQDLFVPVLASVCSIPSSWVEGETHSRMRLL